MSHPLRIVFQAPVVIVLAEHCSLVVYHLSCMYLCCLSHVIQCHWHVPGSLHVLKRLVPRLHSFGMELIGWMCWFGLKGFGAGGFNKCGVVV